MASATYVQKREDRWKKLECILLHENVATVSKSLAADQV
jgi:hypothetical protein